MSLFSRKKQEPNSPVNLPQNGNIQSVTESLYKQNLELAVKNKTLSLLSKLYGISILTLPPQELASQITNAIQADFSFELVGIFLYDSQKDELAPLGFANSERLKATLVEFEANLSSVSIPNASKTDFFKKTLQEKVMSYSEKLQDIWDSQIPDEAFVKIASDGHIKSSLAYPLVIQEKVIGVLLLSLNRVYHDLVSYEKESIGSFINVISVALDKALIYEQLTISNQELEKANERQEGLIHFISHEVKGYLTKNEAVFSGILEGDYGQVAEETKELAKDALEDTKKGVHTVMDILNASNFKKGTVKYEMKPFDLKNAVTLIASDQAKTAAVKNLVLETHIDADSFMVNGDEPQIREHVIRNLIDNAIRYTPSGKISVVLEHRDNKIIFSVKDSGVGITDDDKGRLFTEGGRGKESIKVNVDSTGYGLYIAKQIVDAHRGRIWAESEGKDKGSTFFIELEPLHSTKKPQFKDAVTGKMPYEVEE